MALKLSRFRVDCRARIFEICSCSKNMSFDVSDPAGHRATWRRAAHDGLHGQIKGWCSYPAVLCKAAACVITTAALPTSPVRGINQLDVSHHGHDHPPCGRDPSAEHALGDAVSCCAWEPCVLRLGSIRAIYHAARDNRRTVAEASAGHRDARRAKPLAGRGHPLYRVHCNPMICFCI